jgi:hypothetical protein
VRIVLDYYLLSIYLNTNTQEEAMAVKNLREKAAKTVRKNAKITCIDCGGSVIRICDLRTCKNCNRAYTVMGQPMVLRTSTKTVEPIYWVGDSAYGINQLIQLAAVALNMKAVSPILCGELASLN